MRKHKKHLDFEINLIPCIDLLSVCICFLLLTAVWLSVGSVNVKQAVGGQPASETEKKPQLWVVMADKGVVSLDLQNSNLPANVKKLRVDGVEGQINWEQLQKVVTQYKTATPELMTALIQPQAQSEYDQIIQLMDEFKKAGVTDLGVVPL